MNAQNFLRIVVAATWMASWAVTSGCAATTAQASPTASAVASAQPDARAVAAIRDVIQRYETALNANAIDDILGLYGSEPVFMPQHAPALVGRDAIRAGYQHCSTAGPDQESVRRPSEYWRRSSGSGVAR